MPDENLTSNSKPVKTKRIAVFFGGKSPEHDVSIVTGLQVLGAIDPQTFKAFPVYVSAAGDWYTGPELRQRSFYVPSATDLRRLSRVSLDAGSGGPPALVAGARSFLHRPTRIEFDFALPAFHGLFGEDGRIQGLFESAGIPYSGMRTLASAVLMDKIVTKRVLAGSGIPMLPYWELRRPAQGRLILPEKLSELLPILTFPCCVKPRNLGSSIGVARASDFQELSDALPEVFRFDTSAIVEPFVQNLMEYNISVRRVNGTTVTSAIELPKHASTLLDFRAKYLSHGGKGGAKEPGQSSQGMLSLTREINPQLPGDATPNIRDWATRAFDLVGGSGAPRIDFLCDSGSGEIWLNEINPCPGSFAYFLWEAAQEPITFPALIEHLVSEGEQLKDLAALPSDPTPEAARLFKRK